MGDKKSIFITTAIIGEGTGGGAVAYHELNSLISNTDVKLVLSAQSGNDLPIAIKSINPLDHKLPWNEFLWDYLAHEYVDPVIRENDISFVFINGNPFGKTVGHIIDWSLIRSQPAPKIIVDVPAHDLKDSIDEHHKFGWDYEKMYPHNVDEFLWDMQTAHQVSADVIVCPSRASVEALNKQGILSDQDVRIIPHGCHLPEKTEPIPDEFRVGYMGSMGADKGVVYLVYAWNALAYKDAVLAYAGKDEAYLIGNKDRPGIVQQVPPQAGAKYAVLGYIPNVSELYNNISVYVQPSVTEGFGLEVLEAMAHGRPPIASTGCGASELITDGHDGLIFDKRDINALKTSIQYFKDNPTDIKKFGDRARETAKKYSWDIIEKKYAELYE